MPKVSAAHRDARRRGILAAAQRCVARKGPAETTMRDICRAANLSPGGVYRYFSGKAEILAALAAQRQLQVERFFRPLTSRSLTRREIGPVLELLAASLDSASASDGLRLDVHLWSEALESRQLLREVSSGHRRIVEGLAESLPGRSEEEREALARGLLALLQGLALQKALEPEIELRSMFERIRKALSIR